MKKKQVLSLFTIGALLCIGFRLYQMLIMIDPETGFYLTEYQNTKSGSVIISVILLVAIILLGTFIEHLPVTPIKSSKVLGIASILLSIPAIIMSTQIMKASEMQTSKVVCATLTLIFAVFMLYYGTCLLYNKTVNQLACLIPVIFAGFRLATEFLSYFGLPRTTDVVIHTLMLLTCMIFWHLFGRYTANLSFKTSSKWLFGFGLAAALMCFTCAFPVYIAQIFMPSTDIRAVTTYLYFDFSVGIYAIIFLMCAFKITSRE